MFNFKVIPIARPKNQGTVEENNCRRETHLCFGDDLARAWPCWGRSPLGEPEWKEQERQSRKKKKVQEHKRKYKVTRMGAGEKAAKTDTAQASCATPASDRGWAQLLALRQAEACSQLHKPINSLRGSNQPHLFPSLISDT